MRTMVLPVLTVLGLSVLSGAGFAALTVGLNQAAWAPLTGLAAVVGEAAGWAAAGWAWAWWQQRRGHRLAVVAASTFGFLAAASVAYYVVEALWLPWFYSRGPRRIIVDGPAGQPVWVSILTDSAPEMGYWILVSAVAGIVLALVVRVAQRPDLIGLLARLTLPMGFLLWSVYLLQFELGIQPRPAVVTAHTLACMIAVAGVLLMIGHARRARP